MKNVFLSHSMEPPATKFANRLKDELVRLGYNVLGYDTKHGEYTISTAIPIRRANIVIGIVTEPNPNVFFEVGCAVGAGRKVLLVVSPSVALPVDLKSFRAVRSLELDTDTLLQVVAILDEISDETILEPPVVRSFRDVLRTFHTDPLYFESVTAEDFEHCLFEFFEAMGFQPDRRHSEVESGCDFELNRYKHFRRTFVAIKKYSSNSRVSVGHVQRLLGVVIGYQGDHAILVSTSPFTRSAMDFARKCDPQIELWQMDDVIERLS